MNNFNNILNEVAITSIREVTCRNLLYFANHPHTRQLMIFMMRPFINSNTIRDNDFTYFFNMIEELEENVIHIHNNIQQVIVEIVDRSDNTNMRLLIDLMIERCKSLM
jgi:hypothetical protein